MMARESLVVAFVISTTPLGTARKGAQLWESLAGWGALLMKWNGSVPEKVLGNHNL
jgi:hypothetical protein